MKRIICENVKVERVIGEKTMLEYNKSKKSLVALWQWWLIRFKFQSPIKNTSLFSWKFFPVLDPSQTEIFIGFI